MERAHFLRRTRSGTSSDQVLSSEFHEVEVAERLFNLGQSSREEQFQFRIRDIACGNQQELRRPPA